MKLRDTFVVGVVVLITAALAPQTQQTVQVQAETYPSELTMPPELTDMYALAQNAPPQMTGVPGTTATKLRPRQRETLNITPEFIDECMEVAEQVNPEWTKKMRHLCDRNPEEFERMLKQSGRHLIGLVQLKRRDPELYEIKLHELRLDSYIKAISNELLVLHLDGKGESTEAVERRMELRVLVQEQVALTLKVRGDYINRLEQHVEALKKQLEDDALAFFRTVEDRYKLLTKMP